MQFNSSRFKLQLKLAVNRLKLLQQKKYALNATQRREIANLLENGKEESARVRVEPIIREDFIMEAFELLEIFCELLLARFGLIETMPMCDSVIREAVTSLIYASPRCDIKELHQVRELLALKYGKEFTAAAIENRDGLVHPKIIQKLKVDSPSPTLVSQYLIEIARAYQVDWSCVVPEPAPKVSVPEKITQGTSSSDIPEFFTIKSLESTPPCSGFPTTDPTAPVLAMETYRANEDDVPSTDFSQTHQFSFEHGTLVNNKDIGLKGFDPDSKESMQGECTEKMPPDLNELSRRFDALKKQ